MNCSGVLLNCTNASVINKNRTDEWQTPTFDASVKNIILAIVLGVLDIVTIFGNLLVILSFIIERKLLQPFNLFILNLAVTDFLVAITAMTFYTIDTLLGYWPFGIYMCAVWIYFDFAMTFASVFTLVAISVDRFWCVTWPIHFKMHNNKKKSAIIIAAVWFCVIAIWTPPFIGDRLSHNQAHYCIWDPADNREFVIFVAVIGHYVPCLIMVFSYIKVLLVMRRQTTATGRKNVSNMTPETKDIEFSPLEESSNTTEALKQSQTFGESTEEVFTGDNQSSSTGKSSLNGEFSPGQNSSVFTVENVQACRSQRLSKQQRREKRIFITLTYILSSYMICWFPFYIAFDVSAWQPDLVPAGLYSFFFWSTYVNSTLNPLIYAYTNKEFREAFIKVQRMFCMCSKLRE